MSDRNDSLELNIQDAVKVASGSNLRDYARRQLEAARSIWNVQRDVMGQEASAPRQMLQHVEQQRAHIQRQRRELAQRFGSFESRSR